MPTYHYDILEPDSDLTIAVDNLQHELGALYKESWDTDKRAAYGDKPFALNIEAFARMWFTKSLKIFMAYDERTPLGFLSALFSARSPMRRPSFRWKTGLPVGTRKWSAGFSSTSPMPFAILGAMKSGRATRPTVMPISAPTGRRPTPLL